MSRHKYGAKPKTVDGIRFASTAEAHRYSELRLLEKAGEIHALEVQPKFPLWASHAQDEHHAREVWAHFGRAAIGCYVGDFRYQDREGRTVVEDVKGVKTPVYRLKRKIVEANYGIVITEV